MLRQQRGLLLDSIRLSASDLDSISTDLSSSLLRFLFAERLLPDRFELIRRAIAGPTESSMKLAVSSC